MLVLCSGGLNINLSQQHGVFHDGLVVLGSSDGSIVGLLAARSMMIRYMVAKPWVVMPL